MLQGITTQYATTVLIVPYQLVLQLSYVEYSGLDKSHQTDKRGGITFLDYKDQSQC